MDRPHSLARLREQNGLEWWEWKRPEDGVRQVVLTGKGCLTDLQTDLLAGEFLDDSHHELLFRPEDGDVDVYKPEDISALGLLLGREETLGESRLLLSVRRGVFARDLCAVTKEALLGAALPSHNRGTASGKIDASKIRKDASQIIVVNDNKRAFYYTRDGIRSSVHETNTVNSGIVGHFPATLRNPYCRLTRYSRDNPEKYEASLPFLNVVSEAFRRAIPGRWEAQNRFVSNETSIREKGWLLGETVFTTITVNKNYRTACHKDAGDYHLGFGNLSVFEGGSRYLGGHTVFPKFRCAVDLREGDFSGMDVHEWHGNTEMSVPGDDSWIRLSLVCYVRVDMAKCGTQEDEKQKHEVWARTWKHAHAKHAYRLGEHLAEQEGLAHAASVLFQSED